VNTAIIRGEHPSVTVVTRCGIDKVRRLWHLPGVTPYVKIGVHNNSYVNLRRGLMERVFYVERGGTLVPPPQPVEGAFEELRAFGLAVAQHVGVSVPSSIDQVVEMYKGDRRYNMYKGAAESLRFEALSPRDAMVKTFVKAEKINMEKKADPAPRVIQPRSPRYNLCVGRYLKKLEKQVYKAIQAEYQRKHGTTGPIVCKGLTAMGTAQVIKAKWERFNDPVAVGLDASRFDQHVSVQALQWEHSVYTKCYRGRDAADLAKLLSMQLHNYGTGNTPSARIKYNNRGGRMSGDINTSLGNCLIMCGLIYAWADQTGVTIDLINNGDDCAVFMERKHLGRFMDGLEAWFLGKGFTMVAEPPAGCLEEIEFCQAKPVRTGQGYVMCRSLPALSKDLHSLLPWDNGKMAYGWATAVGDSGTAISMGMPCFEALYTKLLTAGNGIKLGQHPLRDEGGLYWLSRGMDRLTAGVTDEARVSFWKAFGIAPYMQRHIEQTIERSKPVLNTRGVKTQSLPNYADHHVPPLRHYY